MFKVRGAHRRAPKVGAAAMGGQGACSPGKFFIFDSLKHVFLRSGG